MLRVPLRGNGCIMQIGRENNPPQKKMSTQKSVQTNDFETSESEKPPLACPFLPLKMVWPLPITDCLLSCMWLVSVNPITCACVAPDPVANLHHWLA